METDTAQPPKNEADPQSPEDLVAARFEPIKRWAHATPGSIGKLAEVITAMSGKSVTRQMVGRWLNATNPIQPSHGYGLYLERAYEQLISED